MTVRRAIRAGPSAAILLLGSGCGGTGHPVVGPAARCVVSPLPGEPVRDTVRIMVADSASLERFVRRDRAPSPIDCEGNARRPRGGAEPGPALLVEPAPAGHDLRDLLDRGRADLVVTRDPVPLAYAANTGWYRVVPLPWDVTYVLVLPGRAEPIAPPDSAALAELARDAVRGEARAALPPFWWLDEGTCTAAAPGPSGGKLLGYPARDPMARSLAERIVALLGTSDPPRWLGDLAAGSDRPRIRAIPPDSGMAGLAAAVVPYPRARPADCAPGIWLKAAIPLVDGRPSVIVGRGVPAFEIGGDGSIEFLPRSSR